jgi:putative phosphoserine phosphatase / 1-acylglycerol-3-phosphate O-acyltransferase
VLTVPARGGALADAVDVGRTAAFYGALLGAASTAAAVGLARRSRRQMVDLTCSVAGDLGLALAGIDVEVRGAEHLWSARPCVFVFNHQSKVDVPLLMKLLRGGFTAVAKAEAASIPLWGAMFRLAGVAFVDRGNTRQAKEALEPAVRKLRDEGWSLAIAPEGTRSPTPRLGRFKKGAFHIALQAGVPMVPIVIHDAGEVMWRGHQTLRGGTVHVDVLPPIDTSTWSTETLAQHVADVREQFVAVLEGAP